MSESLEQGVRLNAAAGKEGLTIDDVNRFTLEQLKSEKRQEAYNFPDCLTLSAEDRRAEVLWSRSHAKPDVSKRETKPLVVAPGVIEMPIAEPGTRERIASLIASAALKPHGTRARYVGAKCRCRKCRIANSAYRADRVRQIREGLQPDCLVDSDAARKHIQKLSRKGMGYKAVADAASVSRSVTGRILWGKRDRIRRSTHERLCSVTLAAIADGARVPGGPTLAILQSLLDDGYTKTQLAKWLGSKAKTPSLQIRTDTITARSASKVKRMAILIEQGKLQRG